MNRSTEDVKTNRNKPKSEENKSTNETTWETDPPRASLISTDTSFPPPNMLTVFVFYFFFWLSITNSIKN